MTPQEQTMLEDLLNKLMQTPSPAQDPQAALMIEQSLGRRRDALYVLTQIVMMQNLALDHAQQEIQTLRQAAPAPQSTSFLGGMGLAPPASSTARTSVPAFSSGPPSFLQSIMSTAAGVVAGEATFDVLRSLFGGSSSSGMSSGGFFGGNAPVEAPREETIINNYNDNGSPNNDNAFDASPDDSFQSEEDI